MRFLFVSILVLCVFNACSKKEIQLPQIKAHGIDHIENHSAIWFFFKTSGKDTLAILNKNNKLINTHWIFHIDKRLPLKTIINSLNKLQSNKNEDSMHKNGDYPNYFSYANLMTNQLSLFEFEPTQFISSKNTLTSVSKQVPTLNLTRNQLFVGDKIIEKDQLKAHLSNTPKKIRLIIDGNITYNRYLKLKIDLKKLDIKTEPEEYIYNLK